MEIRKKYNNNIEVSNLGNIKRNGKINKQTESHGYNYIKIDGKKIGVHRLVAHCFLGLYINNSELFVCHKNDIRNDNRVENLFIGTSLDNIQDMINKGRQCIPKIQKYGKNKLSKQILQLDLNGVFIKERDSFSRIYDELGVSFGAGAQKCCKGKYKKSKGFTRKYKI